MSRLGADDQWQERGKEALFGSPEKDDAFGSILALNESRRSR
jgi:hypothetical protein